MARDNGPIRAALLLLSSRTSWVTEEQQKTFEAVVNDYYADVVDDADPVAPDNGLEFGNLHAGTGQPTAIQAPSQQHALPPAQAATVAPVSSAPASTVPTFSKVGDTV